MQGTFSVTVYPRGLTSPKNNFKAHKPIDPYQRAEYAKPRAKYVQDAWGEALSETHKIVNRLAA